MRRPIKIPGDTVIDAARISELTIETDFEGPRTCKCVVAYMENGHRHILEKIATDDQPRARLDYWTNACRSAFTNNNTIERDTQPRTLR